MPNSFASLHYHIVFATHGRHPLITGEVAARLHAYLAGIIESQGGQAVLTGGTADHVHVLAALSKNRAITDTIRDLKSNSSRWVHETFPELGEFAWQAGYGAFTVSISGIPRVKAYIAHQAEHHKETTFEDEFAAFLARHGIAARGIDG